MANIDIWTRNSMPVPIPGHSGTIIDTIKMLPAQTTVELGATIYFTMQNPKPDDPSMFSEFYYLNAANPLKDGKENWLLADGDDFSVLPITTDGHNLMVVTANSVGTYLYCIRWHGGGGSGFSGTKNVLKVVDAGATLPRVGVYTDGSQPDPSYTSDSPYPQATMTGVDVAPDLEQVDEETSLVFTLHNQAKPATEYNPAALEISSVPHAKGLVGFRYMDPTEGTWYRPLNSPPGSSPIPEKPEFEWVSPLPDPIPPDGDVGMSMTILDHSDDNDLYLYLVEWINVEGTYLVCDPKIKNTRPPWPPLGKG